MQNNEAYQEIREKAIEVILGFKPSEKTDKKVADEILRLKGDLRKTIVMLPQREKEILELRYFENLSYDEISKRTGKDTKEIYDIIQSGADLVNKTIKVNLISNTKQTIKTPTDTKQQVKTSTTTQPPSQGAAIIAGIVALAIIVGFFFGLWFLFQNLVIKNLPTITSYASSAYSYVTEKATTLNKNVLKKSLTTGTKITPSINSFKIIGSSSLSSLSNKLKNAFNLDNPKLKINIRSSNSDEGFNSLINGETDIATSSRPVSFSDEKKAAKNNIQLTETRVAIDALVFIVNKKNPINEIDLSTLQQIFNGQVTNWNSLSTLDKAILPLARAGGSGTNEFVISRILEGQDFPETVQKKISTKEIIKTISEDIGAIGFINSSSFPFDNENIKYLKIRNYEGANAVSPFSGEVLNEKALRYGDYPLAHYLYLITSSNSKEDAKSFVEWAASTKGQEVVRSAGLIPVEGE